MTLTATSPAPSLRWLRYAGAFVAGFATVAVLSIATDTVLHSTGIYPTDGSVGSDANLVLALAYRTAFTVLGGYVAAIVGTLAAIAGAIAMWSVGYNWYPVALAVLALPSTALGGWLFTRASR
jgi:hypothetical protein